MVPRATASRSGVRTQSTGQVSNFAVSRSPYRSYVFDGGDQHYCFSRPDVYGYRYRSDDDAIIRA